MLGKCCLWSTSPALWLVCFSFNWSSQHHLRNSSSFAACLGPGEAASCWPSLEAPAPAEGITLQRVGPQIPTLSSKCLSFVTCNLFLPFGGGCFLQLFLSSLPLCYSWLSFTCSVSQLPQSFLLNPHQGKQSGGWAGKMIS